MIYKLSDRICSSSLLGVVRCLQAWFTDDAGEWSSDDPVVSSGLLQSWVVHGSRDVRWCPVEVAGVEDCRSLLCLGYVTVYIGRLFAPPPPAFCVEVHWLNTFHCICNAPIWAGLLACLFCPLGICRTRGGLIIISTLHVDRGITSVSGVRLHHRLHSWCASPVAFRCASRLRDPKGFITLWAEMLCLA